jgi:hypothetical protein
MLQCGSCSIFKRPIEVLANQFNYMALLESEQLLRELAPDMAVSPALGAQGSLLPLPAMETMISLAATSLRPRASPKIR